MKNKRSLNKLGDNNRITSGRTSETEIDKTENVYQQWLIKHTANTTAGPFEQ